WLQSAFGAAFGAALARAVYSRGAQARHARRTAMSTRSPELEHVLSQALQLSVDERAVLAAELWASLHGESDPEVDAAWADEVQRRLERIASGEDAMVPWEEVRERLR